MKCKLPCPGFFTQVAMSISIDDDTSIIKLTNKLTCKRNFPNKISNQNLTDLKKHIPLNSYNFSLHDQTI